MDTDTATPPHTPLAGHGTRRICVQILTVDGDTVLAETWEIDAARTDELRTLLGEPLARMLVPAAAALVAVDPLRSVVTFEEDPT